MTVPSNRAINLTVFNIQVNSVALSWVNVLSGPIVGVRIEVFILPRGLRIRVIDLLGDASLQSTTVSNLLPFTEYEFRLSIRNEIGLSPFVATRAMTLSQNKHSL